MYEVHIYPGLMVLAAAGILGQMLTDMCSTRAHEHASVLPSQQM
jgi:hypothetical protein